MQENVSEEGEGRQLDSEEREGRQWVKEGYVRTVL